MSSFDKIWARVLQETDIRTLSDLADLVGSAQPHISRKKKNDEFPVEWAYKISIKYDVHTDWIMRGVGPKKVCANEHTAEYQIGILNDINSWLKDLVAKEPYRHDWFLGCFEDAFPMFKEWRKRREDKAGRNLQSPDKKIA